MSKSIINPLLYSLLGIFLTASFFCKEKGEEHQMKQSPTQTIQLPKAQFKGNISVEEAILNRRSIREYSDKSLSLEEVSQILWAAQGITHSTAGLRSAPSAGALYPLEIYLAASNVDGIKAGLYKYSPQTHTIKLISEGDKRNEIANAALRQDAITNSAAIVIVTAVYERTSVRYRERTERYVHMEAGHVGQNIYLQAVTRDIGTVAIGAFYDDKMKETLSLPEKEAPLVLYPLGKIKD